jgi:hypothetical protein
MSATATRRPRPRQARLAPISPDILPRYLAYTGMSLADVAAKTRNPATGKPYSKAAIGHLVSGTMPRCKPALAAAVEDALGAAPGSLFAITIRGSVPRSA